FMLINTTRLLPCRFMHSEKGGWFCRPSQIEIDTFQSLLRNRLFPFFLAENSHQSRDQQQKSGEDIKQGNADKSSDGRQQHQESAHFCLELDHDRSDNRECRE